MSDKDNQTSSSSSTSLSLRENRPLMAVVAVITLIMLAAIGVGIYALIDGITGNSSEKDNEETTITAGVENDEESDQESNDSESSSETEEATSEEQPQSDESSQSENEKGEVQSAEENDELETASKENNESGDQSEDVSEQDKEGNVSANGAVSTARKISSLTEEAMMKSLRNQNLINETGQWNATDYAPGDVVSTEHEVQLGDTLWEIAEGYYGTGFDYGKIVSANDNSIGFLPDGSKALITPGTMLTLPN